MQLQPHIHDIVYGQMSTVEKFHGFRGFSLDCESFPANCGLVNQQYKST